MNPSCFLVILTLSPALIGICSAAKSKRDFSYQFLKSADPREDEPWDEEEFLNPNEKKPSMRCLLLGMAGCSEECRLKSQLYDIEAQGACNQAQTCLCQYKNISFDQEWDKKFNADYVHRAILEDEQVHEQVQKIFENPLKTAEQFKHLLEPVITPFQFTKLKICDDTLAAEFTREDGEPDTDAVQKYVSEQVDETLKQSPTPKFLLGVKYKAKLEAALKKARKGTLFNIAYGLDQMKNQTLNDIFQEYLKQNEIEKPEIQLEKQDLNDIFDAAFFNEIIKRIDQMNKSPAPSKSANKSS